MITCKGGEGIPCVMKLANYLRYYQARHGIQLSPEMADEEAAKEGFVIDHIGETRLARLVNFPDTPNGVVPVRMGPNEIGT